MPTYVMLLAAGLAQAAGNAPSAAPAAPLKKLSSVPGVAVTYYEVTGTTIPQLHDWLQKHAPRDPQTQKATPTTSNWSIGSAVKFSKTGSQCKLTGATVRFSASVQLPRLADGVQLPATALASWNGYVAALEGRQAQRFGFVHNRLGEVESAIMRSTCDKWQRAADAAIARISEAEAQAFKADPTKLPKLQ